MRKTAQLAAVAALGIVVAAGAQPVAPPAGVPASPGPTPRPRLALVLAGGGALGLAHVGVLRTLEELHVPVDIVTGTSMGAIVGGLYAAGYSPAELERIARELDWTELVRDTPDRRHLPYRRKVDDLIYLTRWELGISRRGLLTPSGLISGHRLGAELERLALRVVGIDDFDRLPLPFRAVAADAATGETVILHDGDLASALRASMAVPGLFAPVERDGRLLVDGGLVANLPVEPARALGAEVVIAVDLGKSLASRERPSSIAGVLSQSLDVMSRREVEKAAADADVVLRPAVDDHALLDFDAADVLIERGAEAARAMAGELGRYAVDEAEWQRYLGRQRRATPEIRIRSLAVDPGPDLAPAAVRRAIRTKVGKPLDAGRLVADLDRLWELGEYERVGFTLTPSELGDWDLAIRGRRKAWAPNILRTGLSLVSDLEGSSTFNLLGALTATRLDRIGGELKVAAQLGGVPAATAELYQPLHVSQIPFVSFGLGFSEQKRDIGTAEGPVLYRFRLLRAAFDVGLALGRYGELRAGVRHDQTRGLPFGEGSSAAPDSERVDAGRRAVLIFDQLDRVNFPRRGLLLSVDLYETMASLGADDDYRRLDVQSVAAASRGRHTIVGLLHGTSALGGELPPSERTGLGGLFNLSGFPTGRVSGSYGGVGSLLYLYRLGRLPKFGEGIYAGVSLETGNVWERADQARWGDLRRSWSVIFGADTLLGPVYLGHGRAEGGYDAFYFYLGRTF